MTERDETTSTLELLMDPEVIAWLEDYRPLQPIDNEIDKPEDDAPAAA